ncbi:hypothetical protein I553_10773 [Mycobacterium xenopi 4042]|uniref:Uncharacterized protein n=1 Tax=Mycobacterium xenopi 4042 TaxID=1299334 RepID=X8DBN6_MYCXE|nr:hypothetical protein I553_10773 [Mycobacterium xenopi 4042]
MDEMEGECVDSVGPPFRRALRVNRHCGNWREGLRVEVGGQRFGSHCCEVDGRCALADTAFLVQNSDNSSHRGEGPSCSSTAIAAYGEQAAKDYVRHTTTGPDTLNSAQQLTSFPRKTA